MGGVWRVSGLGGEKEQTSESVMDHHHEGKIMGERFETLPALLVHSSTRTSSHEGR